MKVFYLLIFLLFCGCSVNYHSSPKLPEDKQNLISYIAGLESDIKNLEIELEQNKKDIEYAEKYLIEHPDGFWTNNGGNRLSHRVFKRDSTLFNIKCLSGDLERAKSKLENLEKINE